ncbi:MAG: hypothetical protein EP348_08280, partial [Alphaproteobacteria bacterium]
MTRPAPLFILSIAILFGAMSLPATAHAGWLDKLKDTAKDLTDKAGEIIDNAEPTAPTTSDGEGQATKTPVTATPAKPTAPETQSVAKPAAPTVTSPASAKAGNNDKALVMATQKELKRLKYSVGVDGDYGPNTKKAILAFQEGHNLSQNGDVSESLLSELKAAPTPLGTAVSEKNEILAQEAAEENAKKQTAAMTTAKPAAKPGPKKATDQSYDTAGPFDTAGQPFADNWRLVREKPDSKFWGRIGPDANGRITLLVKLNAGHFKRTNPNAESIQSLLNGKFRKTDSYDPPSKIMIRFDGVDIYAKNISQGGSTTLNFLAEDAAVAKLFERVKNGGDFEFRLDGFEPFEYSKEWVHFMTPPPAPVKAAAKLPTPEEVAANEAAKKKAQASTMASLSPVGQEVYKNCTQGKGTSATYYSCGCIGAEADDMANTEQKKRLEKLAKDKARWTDFIEKAQTNPKYDDKKKQQMADYGQRKLDEANERYAALENRSSWSKETRHIIAQSVASDLYRMKTCKRADGFEAEEYKECMQGIGMSKNSDPEASCRCSGKKAG